MAKQSYGILDERPVRCVLCRYPLGKRVIRPKDKESKEEELPTCPKCGGLLG